VSSNTVQKMPDFCSRRFPFHYVTALNVLMKMGINLSSINLLAVSEFENYKGEIHQQSPKPGEQITADTQISLHVGCLSAADHVPYQFFYGVEGGRDRSSEWEDRARETMAPFDSAVIRYRALAGYEMHKFNLGVLDRDYLISYLDLFDFAPGEDAPDISDLLFWVAALPAFHRWAGNAEAVAAVLHSLIGYPVEIVESVSCRFDIPEAMQSHLGTESGRLGQALLLGNSFTECDSGYRVNIREVAPDDIANFLPHGAKRRKLDWLLNICMPGNLEAVISIEAAAAPTVLGSEAQKGYLGYSTYV
jgi:type VI secretion system (T6SS) VasB/ImpH family protein